MWEPPERPCMDLREATAADVEGIRRVARESLAASYGHALDEAVRESAVDHWYDDESLGEEVADEDAVLVVAVDDGEVVGFVQAYFVGDPQPVGRIDWLHVDPDQRGKRLGEQLLGRAETELLDRGAERLEGRVLEINKEGADFYEDHDYEAVRRREVEVGGESVTELTFLRRPEDAPARDLVETYEIDEREVYVAYDESQRAAEGPFYATYLDPERSDRYGWFCGSCESLDTAMDTMDRIECNVCGNRSKPTRWDAAYL